MKDQAEKLRKIAFSIHQQIEAEMARGPRRTRVIVISSGKGGVGKSTLALNISLALSLQNRRVVLMDADMGLANLDIMLGLLPKYTIQHVVQGRKRIKDIIIPDPSGISIIPGGSGINELANLNDADLNHIIGEIGKLDGDYDYMIIDTGAGISRNVINFLLAADDVIIVTTAEPTSLTDAYGMVKTVVKESFKGRMFLIVNKAKNHSEGIMVAEKFKIACKKFLETDIVPIGNVVEEPAVKEGIMRQEAFIFAFPQCTAAKNVHAIAQNLVGGYDPGVDKGEKGGGVKGFLRKFASLF